MVHCGEGEGEGEGDVGDVGDWGGGLELSRDVGGDWLL